MEKLIYSIFALMTLFSNLNAQEEIKLYKNGPTESNEIKEKETFQRADFVANISEPRMYFYGVTKDMSCGTAVLICPGGGYSGVSVIKEGEEIAKWFNQLGISAFVLYYRMPNGHCGIPLVDAQTALKIIHERAKEWNINKNSIGIMGFSAGGHLASTVGTHFKTKTDRPAFMILGYPVITMNKELTHKGSRNNLLGNNPSDETVKLFSNELQITKDTPPAFIVYANDDKTVPVENSRMFYKELQSKNISSEIHSFDIGGHGFGMRKNGIPADNWPDLLKSWLKSNKLIK